METRFETVILDSQIPVGLEADFLGKLAYVSPAIVRSRIERKNSQTRLVVELHAKKVDDWSALEKDFRDIAKLMFSDGFEQTSKVYYRSRNRLSSSVSQVDPHVQLESVDEVYSFGRGRFGFGPQAVSLMSFFEAGVVAMASEFKATAQQYPAMIGAKTLADCNYFKSFPHAVNFVCHLDENIQNITKFSEDAVYDDDALRFNQGFLAAPETLLSPSVCFHCYQALHGRVLEYGRTFTALGKCFRYESSNLRGLERLWDFSMREIIFVGDEDFVLEKKDLLMEMSNSWLEKLGLSFEVRGANDPFFPKDFSGQVAFQDAFDLKQEIRADLPYKNSDLAIGSFNYHQDFFGRAFNIKLKNGDFAHTGCLGYGYERMLLAFYAQYGIDPAGFPAFVRDQMGSGPNP